MADQDHESAVQVVPPARSGGVAHTAGPWVQCKDGDCTCGFIFGAAGQVYVAQAFGEPNVDEHGLPDPHPTGEECGANARLISAAPDLLAAIVNSDDAHWTPAMRAAMAKATGAAS